VRVRAPRVGGQVQHAAGESLPLRIPGGPGRALGRPLGRQAQPRRRSLNAQQTVIGVGVGVFGSGDVPAGGGIRTAPEGGLGRRHGHPAPHVRMPAPFQGGVDLGQIPVHGWAVAPPGGQDHAADEQVEHGDRLHGRPDGALDVGHQRLGLRPFARRHQRGDRVPGVESAIRRGQPVAGGDLDALQRHLCGPPQVLGHETGLADARLTTHEHPARVPVNRRGPRLPQHGQLG
jgi:hypothetical protein